jgi:hypothetical protein
MIPPEIFGYFGAVELTEYSLAKELYSPLAFSPEIRWTGLA